MSRQQPYPYIISHAPCMDGFTAAYCAWSQLGDQARYIGLGYQDNVPALREGADLYLLDFTFKRDVLLDLAKRHPKIVILDHHVTSQEALTGIEKEAPNIEVHFDMEHSGAHLAWQYFQPGIPVPDLIRYVEDRDLWRNALPNTKAISAGLFSYELAPKNFWVWNAFATIGNLEGLRIDGEAILRNQERQLEALLLEARATQFALVTHPGEPGKYFVVPAVNAPYFLASDLGHRLLEKYPDAPFAAVYRDTATGRRDWSLRSEDERQAVSEIATFFGGGGHRNAAGMSEKKGEIAAHFFSLSYDQYQAVKEQTRQTLDASVLYE